MTAFCHICDLPIVVERHDCHHTGCPNHNDPGSRTDCDCYLPAHPWCCNGPCTLPEPAPIVDRYDPDELEPMGGDPYWKDPYE